MRTTSASSRHGMATRTGPKISSRAKRHSFDVSAKIVGTAKYPSVSGPAVGGKPPMTSLCFRTLEPFIDIPTDLPELVLVDDRADIASLVEWITDLSARNSKHRATPK